MAWVAVPKLPLAYGILGAFALALARSGLPDLLAYKMISTLKGSSNTKVQNRVKYLIYFTVALAAVFSQNLIPVHIAFIPVLIPPLLSVFNHLNLDRRCSGLFADFWSGCHLYVDSCRFWCHLPE